ncbi:MAG: hypothetical protein U1E82_09760 [Nitrosomonas sp.]|nr:hypothetical protein [Nitrosomonas sp.]HNB00472.1 hypothetical protein [Nitrosomonas sp.]HNC40888.1 hypothetical protein [Nitrosomonas sp.]
MNPKLRNLAVAIVFSSFASMSFAVNHGTSAEVKLYQLSEEVQHGIITNLQGGEAEKIEKSGSDSSPIYEVQVKKSDKSGTEIDRFTIKVDSSGNLISN